MKDAAARGGDQLKWDKIQKTLAQMFGGQGLFANQPNVNTPGGLMANSFIQALQQPGQLTPVSYIRAQEQANMMQQALQNRGVGQMSQLGMGFNNPLAQTMWGTGTMQGALARQEALRDVLMAQEQKSMADRAYGAQGIGTMYNMAQGLRAQRGGLYAGSANLAAAAPNPWSALGTSTALMADYFASRNQQQRSTSPFVYYPVGQPSGADYLNMDMNQYLGSNWYTQPRNWFAPTSP